MTASLDLRLRRDVAWNLVPVALLGVVGIGLSFAIAGVWGPAAFAVFNLVTTVYFNFGVVGALGLQFSVLRAVAEQPDDRDRVAAVVVGAVVPSLVLAALVTALFIAVRPVVAALLHSPGVADGMLWAAPGLFCFIVNKVLFGVVNGLRRMRAFAVYTSLRYLLIAAGVGIAWIVGLAADRLAAIWSFTEAIVLVVLAGELVATVSLSRARGWTTWVGRHLGYGVRGVAATLAYELNSKLDVMMLGALAVDQRAIGIYALAAALQEGVLQLANVVQNNLDPVIARHHAAGEHAALHALIRRTRRWFVPALIAVCATAAALYPHIIPRLLGDPAFAGGAVAFAVFMAGIALASPYLPFAHLLLMARRPGWHTVLLVATVAANAAANLVLIPALGPAGAATAMSITLVASSLLLVGMTRWCAAVKL